MSSLINLDQVRANNALKAAKTASKKEGEGDNLSGYPSLIINNGLIATLAFSIDKGSQHERIADAIADHLNERNITNSTSGLHLRDELCKGNSSLARRATTEALAFLSYLKRFQKK